MRAMTAIVILFMFCLLIFGCTGQEKTITLRIRLQPGEKLTFQQTTKGRTKIYKADSLTSDRQENWEAEYIQEVISIDPDSTIQLVTSTTITGFSLDSLNAGKIDSSSYTSGDSLRMKPNGRVVDIKPIDPDVGRSVEWLQQYMEQGMPVFPSGEISIPYSWTQTVRVMLPEETMDASIVFTVKSLVRELGYDCALIEYDGTLYIPVPPSAKDTTCLGGIDRLTTTGKLYFAYTEGTTILERAHITIDSERITLVDGKEVAIRYEGFRDVEYALVDRQVP
ncbi:MAG: hypothetical protein KAU35_06610 [candidate division Zixibacteria bacterium]|nr:hypothetical protein [candidate division Zixibacteria bacterium]